MLNKKYIDGFSDFRPRALLIAAAVLAALAFIALVKFQAQQHLQCMQQTKQSAICQSYQQNF